MKKTFFRRTLMVTVVMTALVLAILGTASSAMAAKPDGPVAGPGPFLCPAVGNETAAAHNGQGWGALPAAFEGAYTFLPGNNQAGAHANPNGYGDANPGESLGPGDGNSGWGPIWPGNTIP